MEGRDNSFAYRDTQSGCVKHSIVLMKASTVALNTRKQIAHPVVEITSGLITSS
jgi:hypothetical protein